MQQLTDLQCNTRLLVTRQECAVVTLAPKPPQPGPQSTMSDYELLTYLYNQKGCMDMTLEEAAKFFNLTPLAIRKAHTRLIRRLRHELTTRPPTP